MYSLCQHAVYNLSTPSVVASKTPSSMHVAHHQPLSAQQANAAVNQFCGLLSQPWVKPSASSSNQSLPLASPATAQHFVLQGREGRWNCRCICCHCAVISSLLDTFTTWWYSPDLVNCRSRSWVNLRVKGKPPKPLHHCEPLQGLLPSPCRLYESHFQPGPLLVAPVFATTMPQSTPPTVQACPPAACAGL
jgi:hypothetical protein